MTEPSTPPETDLEMRMRDLKRNLKAGREASSPPPEAPSPLAQGLKGASEFIAAIVLGGAIGLGIDHLVGARPLFSIVFFFLGVVAGVFNVVRATLPKRPK